MHAGELYGKWVPFPTLPYPEVLRMNFNKCPYCANDMASKDWSCPTCCARYIADLPTRAAMANTARRLHEKHGHPIEDLRREVMAIIRRRSIDVIRSDIPR